jgi:inner membrane protease subunit 1
MGPLQVPTGHVWIQGDNLLHSLDSRVYGPVPLALVRGQVFLQVGAVLSGQLGDWRGG